MRRIKKTCTYKPCAFSGFAALLLALFSMCAQNPAGVETQHGRIIDISATEAKALIDADDSIDIIDVRIPAEFHSGHIPNAVNIDFNADSFSSTVDTLNKMNTYIVYCRSDNRSRSAAELMIEKEFTLLYNMLGGINQWTRQGYPVSY